MPFQFDVADIVMLAVFLGIIWLIGWSVYRLIRKAVADGIRDGRR